MHDSVVYMGLRKYFILAYMAAYYIAAVTHIKFRYNLRS